MNTAFRRRKTIHFLAQSGLRVDDDERAETREPRREQRLKRVF